MIHGSISRKVTITPIHSADHVDIPERRSSQLMEPQVHEVDCIISWLWLRRSLVAYCLEFWKGSNTFNRIQSSPQRLAFLQEYHADDGEIKNSNKNSRSIIISITTTITCTTSLLGLY